MKKIALLLIAFGIAISAFAQDKTYLLKPDRVFDGKQMHEGWVVLVNGNRIKAAGEAKDVNTPPNTIVIDLKGATLMPGLIEGHSHQVLQLMPKFSG